MRAGVWLLLAAALLQMGCGPMKVEDYAGGEPAFRIEEYFAGNVRAWGIFQDRSGKLRRQFTVDIVGEVNGDEIVLTEDFVYRDRERSRRVWRIRKLDEHRYEGRADDVVGVAEGAAYGQALNWRYHLSLEIEGRAWEFAFDDWMFLHEDGVLVNRAEMSKLGIRVGEVTLFFKKEDS